MDVMFHKAVDPAVVTQPPVTLRCEMAAVYDDRSPQLAETVRYLLELVEVYEHNGSGWVFSSFVSIELTLWYLDPLRASASVPLPKWIRGKRAVVNVTGTANDCFKWAVLAGLHPAIENPNRMVSYIDHECKYDFSGLNVPVSLYSITQFATKNNISINVYCVENGKRAVFR